MLVGKKLMADSLSLKIPDDAPLQGRPREGWEEQFAMMSENGDDCLVDPFQATEWEETEWQWE